ncbi:outer membrane beta-barrel family protein [Puia sp. P3]|uniref:outer membrane beta-barrel family protein n=1 Tax=Puia sp. P3 TaxID=3423952 RepID=UPI003D67A492
MGLRAENTRTSGYSRDSDSTHTNSYLKFFPTAYLTWHLGDNRSLSAAYNKRLDRPGFGMLDPYRTYLNSQTSAQGNPLLQPSFTDNAELVLNFGNNETKLYYSYTTGGFDQIAYIDPNNNTTSYTYENYLRSRTWGIEQSLSIKPTNWWTSSNTVNLSYYQNRSTNPSTPQKADLLSGYFSTSNDLTLNHKKNLFFSLGYWYNLPQVSGVTHISAMGSLSASFKALLFDKKVTVGLSATDILKTQLATWKYASNDIQASSRNYFDARQVRLSVSYKFGNKNISVKKETSATRKIAADQATNSH